MWSSDILEPKVNDILKLDPDFEGRRGEGSAGPHLVCRAITPKQSLACHSVATVTTILGLVLFRESFELARGAKQVYSFGAA